MASQANNQAHKARGVPHWVDGLILLIVLGVSIEAIHDYVQAGTFGFSLAGDQNVSWHMVRSAGLTAYILLGASTLWGVFLATRAIKDWSPGPVSLLLHATASWLAVVLGFAHAVKGCIGMETAELDNKARILNAFWQRGPATASAHRNAPRALATPRT